MTRPVCMCWPSVDLWSHGEPDCRPAEREGLVGTGVIPEPQQQQQQQVVTPQPVPTIVSCAQVRAGDGTLLVGVQVSTVTGMFVFFLDGAAARKIGRDIQQLGSKGIVVATADQIPRPVGGPGG